MIKRFRIIKRRNHRRIKKSAGKCFHSVKLLTLRFLHKTLKLTREQRKLRIKRRFSKLAHLKHLRKQRRHRGLKIRIAKREAFRKKKTWKNVSKKN